MRAYLFFFSFVPQRRRIIQNLFAVRASSIESLNNVLLTHPIFPSNAGRGYLEVPLPEDYSPKP